MAAVVDELPAGKTMPPAAGVLLSRPRVSRMVEPVAGRLILLHAPAGYGKSLALFGAPGPWARLWYNADGSDRDPVQLAGRLAAVLGVRRFSPRPDPIPADLAADLAAGLPKGQVTLDIDGAERMGRSPECFSVLQQLLEMAPDRIAMRIATRERPPLPLERLRLSGRLADLGPAQLRFDRHEVAEYVKEVAGRLPSATDVARLDEALEGWPAGLALCVIRRDAADLPEDALRRYLIDEVLTSVGAPVRRLLTRLAMRPGIGAAELADAGADERRALDWVARERFFVTFDDGRYRVHPALGGLIRSDAAGGERRAGRAATRPALSIRALGPFEVRVNDRLLQPGDWRPHGALRLLRLLLSAHHYTIGPEEAAEALWPRHALRSALNSVNVSLHGLRRILEPGLRRGADSRYIVREGHQYRLCVENIDLDVAQFSVLTAAGRGPARRDDLEQAIDVYRGDFLEDELYVDYPNDRREHLKTVHLETLERLGDVLLTEGDVERALTCYRRLLAADPLREDVWARIMRHHLRRGERAAAARAFKACEDALRSGLGVAPGDDLQAMMREAAAAPVLQSTVELAITPMVAGKS